MKIRVENDYNNKNKVNIPFFEIFRMFLLSYMVLFAMLFTLGFIFGLIGGV